jgi:hypothetical protein
MFPIAFTSPDLRVEIGFEGRYYISSPELDACTTIESLRAKASEVVEVVNGLARLIWTAIPPSQAVIAIRIADDGSETKYILAVPRMAVLVGSSGTEEEAMLLQKDPDTPFPGAIRSNIVKKIAQTSERTALRVLGIREPGWGDLYKLLEVIEQAVGRARIVKQGWATGKTLDRFTASANNFMATGLEARHIKPWDPPANPMDIDEARRLIHRLVVRWLAS